MRLAVFTLLACQLVGLWPVSVEATTFIHNNGVRKRRVFGYFVREDDQVIVVKVPLPGGEMEEKPYKKAEIEMIWVLDVKALGKLSPNAPKEYRDYAEELAHKDDAEARETALRLFHIAAHLDPKTLGRSCLVSMSRLASNVADQRKFRAMAYLLDPERNADVLQTDAGKVGSVDRSRESFLRCLRLYRQGQTSQALELAQSPGVQGHFANTPGLVSHQEFINTCKSHPFCTSCRSAGSRTCAKCNGTGNVGLGNACQICAGTGKATCPQCKGTSRKLVLSQGDLRAMLQVELWELADAPGKGKAPAGGEKWSKILASQRPSPLPDLSLETLTQFDPRQCRYRDGRWVE